MDIRIIRNGSWANLRPGCKCKWRILYSKDIHSKLELKCKPRFIHLPDKWIRFLALLSIRRMVPERGRLFLYTHKEEETDDALLPSRSKQAPGILTTALNWLPNGSKRNYSDRNEIGFSIISMFAFIPQMAFRTKIEFSVWQGNLISTIALRLPIHFDALCKFVSASLLSNNDQAQKLPKFPLRLDLTIPKTLFLVL